VSLRGRRRRRERGTAHATRRTGGSSVFELPGLSPRPTVRRLRRERTNCSPAGSRYTVGRDSSTPCAAEVPIAALHRRRNRTREAVRDRQSHLLGTAPHRGLRSRSVRLSTRRVVDIVASVGRSVGQSPRLIDIAGSDEMLTGEVAERCRVGTTRPFVRPSVGGRYEDETGRLMNGCVSRTVDHD